MIVNYYLNVKPILHLTGAKIVCSTKIGKEIKIWTYFVVFGIRWQRGTGQQINKPCGKMTKIIAFETKGFQCLHDGKLKKKNSRVLVQMSFF